MRIAALAGVFAVAMLAGCLNQTPRPSRSPGQSVRPSASPASIELEVIVVQEGLAIPWDIAFAPDGRMFVSERRGRLNMFASGEPNAERLKTIDVPDALSIGEAGVMGVAVDRDFSQFPYLYVCASRDADGPEGPAQWVNQLLRFQVTDDDLVFDGLVFDEPWPRANRQHNGCAVEMDSSEHIWMTVGDNIKASHGWPQLTDVLNGKVLRLNRDGSPPDDNPVFAGMSGPSLIYSMGHRNPQGIGFDPASGDPYTAEHGPERDDEINRIVAGGNYGWPCYTDTDQLPIDIGGQDALEIDCEPADAYRPAVWASGFPTLATSGVRFLDGEQWGDWNGNLLVTTLKEMDVRRFKLDDEGRPQLVETFLDEAYGRLRGIALDPDGALYISTSNSANLSQAGMTPAPEVFEDVIIRVSPAD
jgi:glucose/arabinose dehydrogenase